MLLGKKWHIVSYDIRDRRRLRKVHKLICARGLALQESVFLVSAGRRELGSLLDDVSGLMDASSDDLRAYPVLHPAQLWMSGAMATLQPELPREPASSDHLGVPNGRESTFGTLWRKLGGAA